MAPPPKRQLRPPWQWSEPWYTISTVVIGGLPIWALLIALALK